MTIFGLTIGKSRTPTPSEAASALAHARIANDRAKVRATAREMRRGLGLPADWRLQ